MKTFFCVISFLLFASFAQASGNFYGYVTSQGCNVTINGGSQDGVVVSSGYGFTAVSGAVSFTISPYFDELVQVYAIYYNNADILKGITNLSESLYYPNTFTYVPNSTYETGPGSWDKLYVTCQSVPSNVTVTPASGMSILVQDTSQMEWVDCSDSDDSCCAITPFNNDLTCVSDGNDGYYDYLDVSGGGVVYDGDVLQVTTSMLPNYTLTGILLNGVMNTSNSFSYTVPPSTFNLNITGQDVYNAPPTPPPNTFNFTTAQYSTLIASLNERIYATVGLFISLIYAVTWRG
jgi:hypothetical protein